MDDNHIMCCGNRFFCQRALFSAVEQNDSNFLFRWPILWIIYFLVGHAVGERLTCMVVFLIKLRRNKRKSF
jgi:hypothetical protein